MAENNGDGVRMMLSVEARSVRVSVNLRKRTPLHPLAVDKAKVGLVARMSIAFGERFEDLLKSILVRQQREGKVTARASTPAKGTGGRAMMRMGAAT